MKKLIVVDVSNFIFRAFFAIRPLTSPEGVPVNAVYGVLTMFLKLLSQYRPTHILMARDTAGGSFRNELYDQYKANRTEPPEDLIPAAETVSGPFSVKSARPVSKPPLSASEGLMVRLSAIVRPEDRDPSP